MRSIVILIEKLNGGGAERSAGELSMILDALGYNVTLITLLDDIAYPFSGDLINLGKNTTKVSRLGIKFQKYISLQRAISKGNYQLILDFRLKENPYREALLNYLVLKPKAINMIRSYHVKWYLPGPVFFSKYLYRNYVGINTVSVKIQEHIEHRYGFKNVKTIYSPVHLNEIKKQAAEDAVFLDRYVIALGRLDANKQFDKLLDAYNNSVLHKDGIKLYILGNDPQCDSIKVLLLEKIKAYNLKDKVQVLPFAKNPFLYMKHALFLILSSKNEGLPRVLIEALACGTPVIAFNCDSGPSEIISHEKNGLLVENQDFVALTKALNRLYTDKVLYEQCKQHCDFALDKFSADTIAKQWKHYIDGILG